MQAARIRRRFEWLQEDHAKGIASLRRSWTNLEDNPITSLFFNLEATKELSQRHCEEKQIKWGWDVAISMLSQISKLEFARIHENKYLMREGLYDFPIMNYALREGPYRPTAEAKFSGEDFHCIVQGDAGQLVYFVPERDGLNKGLLVDCLL